MVLRRAAAEALGTFFLVLIGPGAVMVNAYTGGAVTHVGVALAFAFVVIAMIYSLGHLSGAHINPAVTLAFWSVGRFPGSHVLPYVGAQCLGAITASALSWAALGPVGSLGATLPVLPPAAAFGVEGLLSFALMLVIIAVGTDRRVANGFAPLAVGLTVGFCALVGGPLTGGSMNPARSLGPALVGSLWQTHWLYWLAPIAGTISAAHVYNHLRHAEPPDVAAESVPLAVAGPISRAAGPRETTARGRNH